MALLVFLLLSLPFGTLCHELIGHGVTGVMCGGRIAYVEVLGVSLWPRLGFAGWSGMYGLADVDGDVSATGQHLISLGGSMSTWLVSVAAVALLWLRPRRGVVRAGLICLSLWWIDLFTYTLPTWGLRRSILWGGQFSEPCEAAVALGVPRHVYQGFVLVGCVLLTTALVFSLNRGKPDRGSVSLPPTDACTS